MHVPRWAQAGLSLSPARSYLGNTRGDDRGQQLGKSLSHTTLFTSPGGPDQEEAARLRRELRRAVGVIRRQAQALQDLTETTTNQRKEIKTLTAKVGALLKERPPQRPLSQNKSRPRLAIREGQLSALLAAQEKRMAMVQNERDQLRDALRSREEEFKEALRGLQEEFRLWMKSQAPQRED